MANSVVSANIGQANQFEVHAATLRLDFVLVVTVSAEVGMVSKVQMVHC